MAKLDDRDSLKPRHPGKRVALIRDPYSFPNAHGSRVFAAKAAPPGMTVSGLRLVWETDEVGNAQPRHPETRGHSRSPSESWGLIRAPGGFTLIEVMVVVVLIGILATFVRLALGDGGRATLLRDTAHVMQQLTAVAAQEAVFTSRPIALVFNDDHYALQELRDGAWQPRAQDALFRARAVPPGIEVRVATGRETPRALSAQAPAIFFPDGSAETLSIELRDAHSAARAVLTPDAAGYAVKLL